VAKPRRGTAPIELDDLDSTRGHPRRGSRALAGGLALIKVDLSVVSNGYRMSKLIGATVINDKNEKIGTVDDVIAGKAKKLLNFSALLVGGFLSTADTGCSPAFAAPRSPAGC
jgi:hypothetical protein